MTSSRVRGSYLAALALTAGAVLALVLGRQHGGAPSDSGESEAGEQGVEDLWSDARSVVFRCGFEVDDEVPAQMQAGCTQEVASSGTRCFGGTLKPERGAKTVCFPVDLPAKRRVHVSLSARCAIPGKCLIFHEVMGGIREDFGEGPVGTDWARIEGSFFTGAAAKQALIQVQVLAQDQGGGAKFWIDDIEVTASKVAANGTTCEWAESAPALASDGHGGVWLAVLARGLHGQEIRLYEDAQATRNLVFRFGRDDATTLGPPALTATDSGCFLAFPIERDGHWRLEYVFFGAGGGEATPRVQEIPDIEGTAPVSTWANGEICLLWQGWQGGSAAVFGSWLTTTSCSPPSLLSSPAASSRNPSVCSLSDGRLFAAWDSIREGAGTFDGDIYGAWSRGGRWEQELRLTFDPRIEQRPSVATDGQHVWMAWEAWSFREHSIHYRTEQIIAVARVEEAGLKAPLNGLGWAGVKDAYLRAPVVAVDSGGGLWLSYRRASHGGWDAMLTRYAGETWERPELLSDHQSYSDRSPLALDAEGGVAALCCTALARARTPDRLEGTRAGCVKVVTRALGASAAAAEARVEPLSMPATEFTLSERLARSTPFLPRHQEAVDGRTLTLYWGDLHEHTELSVCTRSASPRLEDFLAAQRDIEGLDFTCVTDHDFDFDAVTWNSTAARLRWEDVPGAFITFMGEEWTSDMESQEVGSPRGPFGHRNIIFSNPHAPEYYVATPASCCPAGLWPKLDPAVTIVIPHQLADLDNCPVNWECTDETMEPLAEIWQHRGSYEALGCPRQARHSMAEPGHYLREAWARGLIKGVVASPDHGGGYGKTGVWAEDLTRESIFAALKARHTIATTDAKIALWFQIGQALMGTKVAAPPPQPASIHVKACVEGEIKEVVVFRNNEAVHTRTDCGTDVDFEWVDEASAPGPRTWYDVRVTRADGEMAWASPIWFIPGAE